MRTRYSLLHTCGANKAYIHRNYLVRLDSKSSEIVDDVLFELFLLLGRVRVVKANQQTPLVPLSIVLVQQHGLGMTYTSNTIEIDVSTL